MSLRMLSVLVIVAFVVVFTLQNTETVTLHLLWLEFSIPMAVAAAIPFILGVLAAMLFFWREQRKARRDQQLQLGKAGTPAAMLAATTATGKKKQPSWWW